jgi:superfamily I DNA and/or RNA helicase
MNAELCRFPSQTWYDSMLQPAPGNAGLRLVLPRPAQGDLLDRLLDPEKPVTLLLVDHRGYHQKADLEVEIVSQLAYRLMTEQGLRADQLALISPHRAQNNAVSERLGRLLGEAAALPLIDTVERVQGAERDVIVYAFTTSDLDLIERPFLNNPNRFNVAITRARRKLIVVGSHAFFARVPQTEEVLQASRCFKAFYSFCEAQDSLFFWEEAENTETRR